MFLNILDQYSAATLSPLKNNQLAQYIRTDTKEIISSSINLDPQRYRVHGSSGQGQWAVVPWIAIFDLEITNTATHGYYIVYLFTADMQGVYLSLNQGWTYYENEYGGKIGLEKIQEVTLIIQSNLDISEKGFTKEGIFLNVPSSYSSSTQLQAKGYQFGHIAGKYYSRDKMPNDDVLRKDLLAMLDLYGQLKKQNNNQYKDI
jgi:5-methylcytosine-specific restriction protein A